MSARMPKNAIKGHTSNSLSVSTNVRKSIYHADGDNIFNAENAYSTLENVFSKKLYAFFGQHQISLRASYPINNSLTFHR